MSRENQNKKWILMLLTGIAGCVFMSASDWTMIYGDTFYEGKLAWLTLGVAGISPQRNALALLLALPAVIFYSIALVGLKKFIQCEKQKKIYLGLTTVGMTPWLAIHLFYVMILYLFSWLISGGNKELAYGASEALFDQFMWIIPLGEVIMLLPFVYWSVIVLKKKTVFPRIMAVNNPVLIFVVMKAITYILPDKPFRLAFLNGLMSESMAVWFIIFIVYIQYRKN